MKPLREAVSDYLMMRRGLGFKLRHVEHDLGSFVSFMELEKAPFVRSDLALKWAMAPHRPAASLLGAALERRAWLRTVLERH
jgi:hypothetical protein